METIVFRGKTYKIPESVVRQNQLAGEDVYGQLFLQEMFTGLDDFNRIEADGHDWLDSQCFDVYGEYHGIHGDDAMIDDVRDGVYGWFSDWDKEDHEMHYFELVK